MKVLQNRFKSHILCLTNFSEDPNLIEFVHLSQPRLLAFVLNVAKNLKPKSIKLCNNDIKTLDALKILPAHSIVSLDLRHNLVGRLSRLLLQRLWFFLVSQIRDLAELKYLDHFNITELWLEGNPLCELYDEYSYVQQVIEHCPKMEKLVKLRSFLFSIMITAPFVGRLFVEAKWSSFV